MALQNLQSKHWRPEPDFIEERWLASSARFSDYEWWIVEGADDAGLTELFTVGDGSKNYVTMPDDEYSNIMVTVNATHHVILYDYTTTSIWMFNRSVSEILVKCQGQGPLYFFQGH